MDVRLGDVMPGCERLLRPDGTIEHGSILHDPIRLHVVLAADVSPSHEQAIIDASGGDDADAGGIYTDDATRPRLWHWWIASGAMGWVGCVLHLRPRPVQLPPQAWHIKACSCCIDSYRQTAREWLSFAQAMPTRGLPARVVVVGRDARVLMIASVACHNAIARQWLAGIAGVQVDPPARNRLLHHICGQPDLTSDPDSWLIKHGWMETPQQERLRRRRLRARQRQRRAGR